MQACAHPAHKYLCYVRNNAADAWTEPLQTSKMGSFSAAFNGFSLLTIAAKVSILDVYRSFGYASWLD